MDRGTHRGKTVGRNAGTRWPCDQKARLASRHQKLDEAREDSSLELLERACPVALSHYILHALLQPPQEANTATLVAPFLPCMLPLGKENIILGIEN